MPTYEQEILREAQELARLRLRARKLRADLKQCNKMILHSQRTLRKLIGSKDWHETGAKSKIVPDGK